MTADDVVLMLGGESPTTELEFNKNVVAPSFQALYIMTDKKLYTSMDQSHMLKPAIIPHEDYAYTYQVGEFSLSITDNITLDLYVEN